MGEEGDGRGEKQVTSSNGTLVKLYSTEVIFPQARIGPGGVLMFPVRGAPPGTIQGYRRDPNDKYKFIPLIKQCILRESKWRAVCGGIVQRMFCKHFDKNVTITDCENCIVRKEK